MILEHPMAIIIKSGKLVTDSESYFADILIQGEKIVKIGKDLEITGAEIIDANGKLILPGGVDPHTHFDLPMFGTVSSDDHYSGLKAAAFGGTTTVIDFVPQESGSFNKDIETWHRKADHKAAIDFGFHMNITRWDDDVQQQMSTLPSLGITSIKVFTAYNGRLRLQDGEIFQVLRKARESQLLTLLHAENGDVIDLLIAEALSKGNTSPIWHAKTRPAWGAVEAVLRGASLAAMAEAPLYIVHMNVAGEVDQIEYARQNGIQVMGETCPQYLLFTEDTLNRPDGAKWICSPPVRSEIDQQRLWQGLKLGSIQVIATDHCPFFYDGTRSILYEKQPVAIPGKELGTGDFTKIPNGLPGVGDRLPIVWTFGVCAGHLTPNQFVAVTSTNSAKIFGLYPKKGALLPGSDADLVLWDPEKRITYGIAYAHHRTDYNLFEGYELCGFPEKVFLRGRLIVDQGQWLGRPGMGQYIYRDCGCIL
jgi:dihydropyrimidinase